MEYKAENNKWTNKNNKQKLIDTDNNITITREKGHGKGKRIKGVKDTVMEEDLTLGGGHAMEYTGDVSENCTLDTKLINWYNPINLT